MAATGVGGGGWGGGIKCRRGVRVPKHFSGVPFFCLLLICTDWGGLGKRLGEGGGGSER